LKINSTKISKKSITFQGVTLVKKGYAFQKKPVRTLLLYGFFLLAITAFIVSAYHTAVNQRSLPSHTATTHDRALRGEIISGDGYTLGKSSKTYKATLFTQSIDHHKTELLVQLFAIYSHIDADRIRETLDKGHGYTVLAENLDSGTAIRLKSLAYKLRRMGVFVPTKNRKGVNILYGLDIIESGEERSFPLKDTLSPVVGYVRDKAEGKYTEVQGVKGLERYYEKYLGRNQDGFVKGMRDVSGTIIRNKASIRKVRKDGMNLHLNIPLSLQRRVELTLDQMKAVTQAQEIIAGVMESRTGKVLALASSERYDPDHITQADVSSLNPKFAEFLYEPGSVMKPITLAIALEAEKITPETWLDTKGGKLKISEKYTISDDEIFDTLTATDVIVHSSNVGISKIAWRLTGKQFYEGFKKFGFGEPSGIDLSRELSGKIKSAKLLSGKLHRANQAYGYGMYATFAQLWKAYSAFNNNGIAVTPRIAAYLQNGQAEKYLIRPPVKDLHPISRHTAQQMKQILKKVVQEGTGKAARYPGLEVGGKTGTAHIVEHRKYIDKYNSSFFGFVNDDKGNRYTIGVLAIRLKKKHKHFASQSAVPTFKKIVTNLIEQGYLQPDLSVIEQQKLEAQEKKRQAIAKQKQRQRTRKIKAKLKKEREEIRRKQKRRKHKPPKRRNPQTKTPYHQPSKPRRPTPHEALPDLF